MSGFCLGPTGPSARPSVRSAIFCPCPSVMTTLLTSIDEHMILELHVDFLKEITLLIVLNVTK